MEVNADNKKAEQTVKITAASEGESIVTAKTDGISRCDIPEAGGKISNCFPKLTFIVLPAMSIPAGLTVNQKLLLQVLLAETSTPQKGYFNQKEAKEAMSLMHDSLYNRINSPKSRYLDVPESGDKLQGLIYNGRVIKGFKAGKIDQSIQNRINQLIDYANDGGNNMDKYRILLSDAIDIAKKDNIILSHDVIGWRTDDRGLGGGSVEVLKKLQGQFFLKLNDSFHK
ncbi:hypothetical protein [Morganella morganii]|uniref:hypothetical protein n=1 Tax=Morganella morganii TaxID=582 RepID=UPI001BDB784D|nr:hypothetical protein [Morganella morganii]MBT0459716.1 hypothetical protein [Morganella morganii subsp. morganii]